MSALLRNKDSGMSAEDHTADSDTIDEMAARAKANGHDDIARLLMQASGAHRRESVRKQADDMEQEGEENGDDDDQDEEERRDRRQTRNSAYDDDEEEVCDPDSDEFDEERCNEIREMQQNRLYTDRRRFLGNPRSKAGGGLVPRGVVSNLAPSRKLVAHLRRERVGNAVGDADVSRDNFSRSGDCGQDFGDRYSDQRVAKQRPTGRRGDMTYDLPRQDPSTSDQYDGSWVPKRRDTKQDEADREEMEQENARRLRMGSRGERDLGGRPTADDLPTEPPDNGPSKGRSPLHRNARSDVLVPPSSDFASLSLQQAGPGRDKWAAFIRHR
jgi:hypothetical protein